MDWRDDGDFLRAEQCIDLATGECENLSAFAIRRATICQRVNSRVEELLTRHWPEVAAIAGALLDRTTLRGDEVARIFERSLREREIVTR